jgi:hypothetical protein
MFGRISADLPQQWTAIEHRFPGCSAAFDRDLGERWLAGRDGPRFEVLGTALKVFAGESEEHGHAGPWASAAYDLAGERWVVTRESDPQRR